MIKIMHTADWHLGKMLKNIKRDEEFRFALQEIYHYIQKHQPHILLISGDIFDTASPPIWAQELYYNFLKKLYQLPFRLKIIITAGNHDSPSFLDAPKALLSEFHVSIIGRVGEASHNEQLIPYYHEDASLGAIILAVPYLRDSEIRKARSDGSNDEWEADLHLAMSNHYQTLIDNALALRGQQDIPIITMGHLFLLGGQTNLDDGMRPSVGTLGEFRAGHLFDKINYLALGHLHQPQMVAKQPHWRYSGSLLKFAFSEINHTKSINLVEFHGESAAKISLLPLSEQISFYKLEGSLEQQKMKIVELEQENRAYFLELNITQAEISAARMLQEELSKKGSLLRIIQLSRSDQKGLQQLSHHDATLAMPSFESMSPLEIFEKRLELATDLEDQLKKVLITHFKLLQQQVEEAEE